MNLMTKQVRPALSKPYKDIVLKKNEKMIRRGSANTIMAREGKISHQIGRIYGSSLILQLSQTKSKIVLASRASPYKSLGW